MHTCLECGNSDMRVRVVDGASVHECGLCGARFGDRRAVTSLNDADMAATRGIGAGIWPLVRVLERLQGVVVRSSAAADPEAGALPFVELGATSADCLVQLENLAKSLRLGAGTLRLPWCIEVDYQQHLAFVLRPRLPDGPVHKALVRDADHDVEMLWRQLERDTRLAWWRHATPGDTR
ncbi:MAG: hypothetical protein JNK15_06665 [Planctomycetes bacterium]|nr:hypothetical protein [Planctomycetota bacterium]